MREEEKLLKRTFPQRWRTRIYRLSEKRKRQKYFISECQSENEDPVKFLERKLSIKEWGSDS